MKSVTVVGFLIGTVVVCGQANYDGRWSTRSSDGGSVEVRVEKNRIVGGGYSNSRTGGPFTGVSKPITKGSFTFTATSHTELGEARLTLSGMFKANGSMDGSGIYTPPAGTDNPNPAAVAFTWSGAHR
jgi:hypothetical protein